MAVNHEKEMPVVYILGAGASKAVISTAPLMDHLLSEALKILEQREQEPDAAGTKRLHMVKNFIDDVYQLKPGVLPRLEDILTQLDLAVEEDRPLSRHYNVPYLRRLREAFVYAICVVLAENLSSKGSEGMELMWKFLSTLTPEDSMISLNYDIIVDKAISLSTGGRVNYGFPVRYDHKVKKGKAKVKKGEEAKPYELATPPDGLAHLYNLPLYKLHGSFNWLYCPFCQDLDVAHGSKIKSVRYPFEEEEKPKCVDCDTIYEPLIITPTMLKTYRNIQLRQIWRQAENKISRAGKVVFVGYSIPDADVQLRCMFKRALYTNRIRSQVQGSSRCTIHVVGKERQPNDAQHNPTYERYLQLFGEVKYEAIGFRAYIEREFEDFDRRRTEARKAATSG